MDYNNNRDNYRSVIWMISAFITRLRLSSVNLGISTHVIRIISEIIIHSTYRAQVRICYHTKDHKKISQTEGY
jgi:hypothetical protein